MNRRTMQKSLEKAAFSIGETANAYCSFIQLFMKQQEERPDGITVTPHEFQDGFRALNHLTIALQRIMAICGVDDEIRPDDHALSHSDKSDGSPSTLPNLSQS